MATQLLPAEELMRLLSLREAEVAELRRQIAELSALVRACTEKRKKKKAKKKSDPTTDKKKTAATSHAAKKPAAAPASKTPQKPELPATAPKVATNTAPTPAPTPAPSTSTSSTAAHKRSESTSDADGFTTVTARKRRREAQSPTPEADASPDSDTASDEDEEQDHMEVQPAPPAKTAPAEKRPPPVILREKTDYVALMRLLASQQITATATNMQATIRLQPKTPDDYRRLTRLLEEKEIQHHTYEPAWEKRLKVVIRGVAESITTDEVKEELSARGYPVICVSRMGRRRALPLVIVQLPRTDIGKAIYNLTDLLYLKVSVETLKKSSAIGQCHRCQEFGHAANRCRAHWRCVRCGEGHATATCTKEKGVVPATCANCSGEHPANYMGCPKWPKPRPATAADRQRQQPQRQQRPTATAVTPTTSYSAALSKGKKPAVSAATMVTAPPAAAPNATAPAGAPNAKAGPAATKSPFKASSQLENLLQVTYAILPKLGANEALEMMAAVLAAAPELPNPNHLQR